ncbi:MAG: HAMP domain-containing protein [Desulfosudis oleivorans]|jgi:HAMP domain-containing protein|nr:HAMP domain-containing protein [Desulfosudis oleivorans]
MAHDKKGGMGLLPRLILGIFIPILLAFLIIGNILFLSVNFGKIQFKSIKDIGFGSLSELSSEAVKESTAALNKLGERVIQEKAQDVAKQIEIFVKSQPSKSLNALSKNSSLKEIAVQKVGETGYTAVHDSRGINYFHANPKIVGTDLHQLAPKLPEFWKILEVGLAGPASGYYNWKDSDGSIRPKFMYTTPVQGTNLIVAATTYIDEFSKPAKAIIDKMSQIEKTYSAQYNNRFRTFSLIVLLDLLILLVVIYLYSYSIIRPIRYLSDVADKISMGDLKTTIKVKTKGEVAVLAESIGRMQTSVKAAIDRLQRRKENGNPPSAAN